MNRVQIWGVLNVTPDSFSDGGRFATTDRAVAHGLALRAQGADVVDVGGASSRPAGPVYGAGAEPVPVEEELRRVVPVVRELVRHDVLISVDTVRPEVAEAALREGARCINDVSMGRSEALLAAVARAGAEIVLMHNRGRGEIHDAHTTYADVVGDVVRELQSACARAEEAGIAPERIWIDPGLGFAKHAEQSLTLLARLRELVATGRRVLVGASRKSFLAAAAPWPDGTSPTPQEREPASAVAAAVAVLAGATAVRVHDVRAAWQAVRLSERLREAGVSC
ncbi:MAG: dihydropteroate synthase [Myxococcota bacterium]|nr:dihydropteroate synthase [Myxococcota bacterium]MDW8362379.1 dihydropteroate synthase [Myxococcales bacterium]